MERPRWRLVLLGVVLAGLTLGTARVAAEQRGRPPARGSAQAQAPEPGKGSAAGRERRQAKQAVIVGSSSVKGSFGRIIAADLERWGFAVTRRGVVSAGLARPDFRDFQRVVDEVPISQDTFAVLVYVGVNDGQSLWLRPGERGKDGKRWLSWRDPRWDEVYQRRARQLFRSICERGARHAVVMLPAAVAKPSLERKLTRIRRLQQQAARGVSCAQAIATSAGVAELRGRGKRLRLADGFHMSRLGARHAWQRVRQRASSLVAFTGAAPPGVGAAALNPLGLPGGDG